MKQLAGHKERSLWKRGIRSIAGVDEVGRGTLAGPVVAAAVLLKPGEWPAGLNDSKQLTPSRRQQLACEIRRCAQSIGIGVVGPTGIESLNIAGAAFHAMGMALATLRPSPEFVLVDGFPIPSLDLPQEAVVRGDCTCPSIAAASVIAKVFRDGLMVELESAHPGYGFAQHKGYCTRFHLERLNTLGPCPVHRKTFEPVRRLLEEETALFAKASRT